MNSRDLGGALDQDRLVDVYYQGKVEDHGPRAPYKQGLPSRPMRNLLMHCGVRKKDWDKSKFEPTIISEESPCRLVGWCGNRPVFDPDGCMPDNSEVLVQTERGIRKLQIDELAKAKGLPSEWRDQEGKLPAEAVRRMTSIHTLVACCDTLAEWLDEGAQEGNDHSQPEEECESKPQHVVLEQEDPWPWEYEYPDLAKDKEWYNERVRKLYKEAQYRPDPTSVVAEGLEALEIHRQNYTEEGPKILQLLWWEFPPEHQEAVRLGSSMRFLVELKGIQLEDSPELTEEQLEVVVKFVEELISLGVLEEADGPLQRVCPLFVVPKPGQPGQWRCIADMRRGGQNEFSSCDPIYMPSSKDILPHMYKGGWSAVADMSKYFHNFLTLPEERNLMGVIHPVTGKHYRYRTLPMGSTNSPSTACRIGEGVLEALRREHPLFKATKVIDNTWKSGLVSGGYDSSLGHGRVELQENGNPVVQVMGFVDDFIIHAQTQRECHEALSTFMDMTVRLGFICQKVKTSPPAQVQKFCGMLYDTVGNPTLKIPPNKISRCIASSKYLLSKPRSRRLSRLSLAVVTGVLQSVVDATPQHVGQAHLRSLYDDLHLLEEGLETPTGRDKYYTVVELSPGS